MGPSRAGPLHPLKAIKLNVRPVPTHGVGNSDIILFVLVQVCHGIPTTGRRTGGGSPPRGRGPYPLHYDLIDGPELWLLTSPVPLTDRDPLGPPFPKGGVCLEEKA